MNAITRPTGADGAIGGFSGLDYDSKAKTWRVISDDRSEKAPARLYTVDIRYDDQAFEGWSVRGVTPLRSESGGDFPPPGSGLEAVDPEALRIDPVTHDTVWSSEGDDKDGFGPAIRIADPLGRHVGRWPLPAMFSRDAAGLAGPRPNKSIEGLAFAPDGASLWVSMEAPLNQDGLVASVRTGALVRLTRLARDGRILAQYAYPIDPIQASTLGPFADNGVSDILMVDDRRMLVLERSGDGGTGYHVRLYVADLRTGEDISEVTSLRNQAVRPLTKRLVLNFDSLKELRIDNLEGMAWGPRLPDGSASLVFVADDNFSADQQTQLLAFKIRLGPPSRHSPASAPAAR